MADSPKQAEAAQALFCAVADFIGKPLSIKLSNYNEFEKTYSKQITAVQSKVIIPPITLNVIKAFLTKDPSWFQSSINVANKFYDTAVKISKSIKNQFTTKGISLFYLRDDPEIMNGISALFTQVNKAVIKRNAEESVGDLVFNNLNKWSPADIYFASAKAKKIFKLLTTGDGKLQKSDQVKVGKFKITGRADFVTFNILNLLVGKLIKDGDLLPLSLKKAPKDVVIKTFNIVKSDVQKNLTDKGIEYSGYIFAQKPGQVFDSKDIKIKINTNGLRIKFRDKGSSGYTSGKGPSYSYQGVLEGGAQSFDGGLGGGSIFDVIANVIGVTKAKTFKLTNQNSRNQDAIKIGNYLTANKIKDAINVNNEMAEKLKEDCKKLGKKTFKDTKEMYKTLATTKGYRVGDKDAKGRTMNKALASREKTQWIWSKYMGGNMISLIEKNGDIGKDIVKAMVLYASSRTKSSSPHYKAADPSSL
jgi:hypothetical protein